MGDMADLWRESRPQAQARRAARREFAASRLSELGVAHESKNGGAHLVVEGDVDFWPGSGLWKFRGGQQGRGVMPLLSALRRRRRQQAVFNLVDAGYGDAAIGRELELSPHIVARIRKGKRGGGNG